MLALLVSIAFVSGGPSTPSDYRAALQQLEPFDDSLDLLLMQLHHGLPPSEKALRVLVEVAPQLAVLESASQASSIDWELDYDSGPELLLPELAPIRRGARLCDATFLVAAVNGESNAAAKAFGITARMANHVSEQRLLISSLVAISALSTADASVGRIIEMGLIDQDLAAALADDYTHLLRDDFMQCNAAMKQERDSMLTWIDRQLEQAPDSLDETFAGLGLPTPDNVFAVAMLRAQLARAAEAYDAIIVATQIKDPEQSIAVIESVESRVIDGEFGSIAPILIPNTSRIFNSRNEAKDLFQERLGVLQRIADGEVESWELATRPWLWILAARRAAESKTSWWTDTQIASDVDFLLLHAMAGQDSLYPEPWGDLDVPVQWWLPGQWNLLQGLVAQAIEHLDTGHSASAAVDVTIALDITVSLANDGRTAPALVAAEALPMLAGLVGRLVTAGQDVTQFAPLIRRLPPVRAPAGLGKASLRQTARLRGWQQNKARQLERWMKARESWDSDQIAYPKPHVPVVVEIPSHAAGLVAVLMAIRATLPDESLWSEPLGVFGPDAPPGLNPAILEGIANKARSFDRSDEPHRLTIDVVDESEAAAATQHLRDAVLAKRR